MTVPVIAIDGPSGSGKGTVARQVAARLGWRLLDSGALYRLVALAGLREGLSVDDEAGYARLAAGLNLRFGQDAAGEEQVFLQGEDVTRALRAESTGKLASRVAAWGGVRAALLDRQRALAAPPGLVADGRDMGSVVFPEAGLKVFLTASPEERARRRYKQLKEKGLGGNLAALSAEIAERDRRDATRTVAPLVANADAIIVDSTTLSIEEVVGRVLALARERFRGEGHGE
ncbi:MAG: (d)CMP kinase [Gammaproteobacteria bacterium]|nr:MAG: (d)CMP kinase [Gammaproteobacteria bacterium]